MLWSLACVIQIYFPRENVINQLLFDKNSGLKNIRMVSVIISTVTASI